MKIDTQWDFLKGVKHLGVSENPTRHLSTFENLAHRVL